jgi:hypothetical protein
MPVKVYDGTNWVTVAGDGAQGAAGASGAAPLTTKGDLLGYDTAANRVAVGANGQTLVADSTATAGIRWQDTFAAGKNKILNGDFGIWQRGTTWTDPAFGTYTSDRYYVGNDGTGSKTFSRQTFAAGTAPVSGYEGTYFFRASQTTAGSGGTYSIFGQKIEDVRTYSGQTVTLSFWAKSAATSSVAVTVRQDFGSGGSGSVDTTILASTATTTGWVRYTGTVAIPSISGKTIGTGSNLTVIFSLPINTTYTLDFWGVQLEAGSVATPFTTATGTIQGELAACQRYYYRNSSAGVGGYMSYGNGSMWQSTAAIIHLSLMCTMRVRPTLTFTTASGFLLATNTTTGAVTSFTVDDIGFQTVQVTANTATSFTGGHGVRLVSNNNGTSYIEFSSEL